jgi:hypothetical protein
MGAHKLEVLKGDRNSIVDHTGILDSDPLAVAAAVAGRVMSITSGGKLEPGLDVGRTPLYAWSGTDLNNYPDVTRDRGMPYAGEPRFGCISWKAAAELSSTEFVDDAGLVPDAPLTCLSNAATADADRGKLCLAGATDVIVGYVSPRGKYTGPDGYATLAFYPAYVAGTTVPVA